MLDDGAHNKMATKMGKTQPYRHGGSSYRFPCAIVALQLLISYCQIERLVVAFQPSFVQQSSLSTSGFHSTRRSLTTTLKSKLFDPSGDDDVESNKINDDETIEEGKLEEKEIMDGKDLARQFYRQVQQNEEKSQTLNSRLENDIRREEEEFYNVKPPSNMKFTGQGYVPPNTRPLPGGSSRNFGDVDNSRPSPRDQMFQREFNLADRAANGLKFQALFAGLVLIFYIYVGVTGGIVSGGGGGFDDDNGYFIDGRDGVPTRNMDSPSSPPSYKSFMGEDMLPPEDFVPVQKDTETSVWL